MILKLKTNWSGSGIHHQVMKIPVHTHGYLVSDGKFFLLYRLDMQHRDEIIQ